MAKVDHAVIERIKNGFLVKIVDDDDDNDGRQGWMPEELKKPRKKILGIPLADEEVWYAADEGAVFKILAKHYFVEGVDG